MFFQIRRAVDFLLVEEVDDDFGDEEILSSLLSTSFMVGLAGASCVQHSR